MGSPNFYTNNHFNAGFEVDETEDELSCRVMWNQSKIVELAANDLNDGLIFHRLVHQVGYHNGFQVYIEEETTAAYVFRDYAKYWALGDTVGVYDCCGHFTEFQDERIIELAKSGRLTQDDLQSYVNNELKTATEKLKKLAKEYGLGQIVGRSWTSSVDYNWHILAA